MILTGKAKKDFNIWRFEIIKDSRNYIPIHNDRVINYLIIEWLDSVGIYITIEGIFDKMLGYHRGFEVHIYQDNKDSISVFNDGDVFDARQQATEAAIKKANEIYNLHH